MKMNIVTHKFNKQEFLLNEIETEKFFEKQDKTNYTVKTKISIKDVINFIVWFLIVGIGSVGLLMLGALLDRI
tara:strand:+ start:259 stop:477 length:219 start_codon:yes stop_codon:yes gene_type:complete